MNYLVNILTIVYNNLKIFIYWYYFLFRVKLIYYCLQFIHIMNIFEHYSSLMANIVDKKLIVSVYCGKSLKQTNIFQSNITGLKQ